MKGAQHRTNHQTSEAGGRLQAGGDSERTGAGLSEMRFFALCGWPRTRGVFCCTVTLLIVPLPDQRECLHPLDLSPILCLAARCSALPN